MYLKQRKTSCEVKLRGRKDERRRTRLRELERGEEGAGRESEEEVKGEETRERETDRQRGREEEEEVASLRVPLDLSPREKTRQPTAIST